MRTGCAQYIHERGPLKLNFTSVSDVRADVGIIGSIAAPGRRPSCRSTL